jgi:hypothetical protein
MVLLPIPFDLHVLGPPLAFILSQDQTLHCKEFYIIRLFKLSYSKELTVSLFSQFQLLNELFEPKLIVVKTFFDLVFSQPPQFFLFVFFFLHLGLQRYELFFNLQTFFEKFLKFFSNSFFVVFNVSVSCSTRFSIWDCKGMNSFLISKFFSKNF